MAVAECTNSWSSVVTWLVVAAGWYVVHRANLSRERRKEQRESVYRMIEEIKSIEASAITFHTTSTHSKQEADTLTWRINRSIRALQRPPLSHLAISVMPMVNFRKSVTLKNFDASNFDPQAPDSQLLHNIRSATDDLIAAIETQRDEKIP